MNQSHRSRLTTLFKSVATKDGTLIDVNSDRIADDFREYLQIMDEKEKKGTVDLEQFLSYIDESLKHAPDLTPDELIDDMEDGDWFVPVNKSVKKVSPPKKIRHEKPSSRSSSTSRGESRLIRSLEKLRVRIIPVHTHRLLLST